MYSKEAHAKYWYYPKLTILLAFLDEWLSSVTSKQYTCCWSESLQSQFSGRDVFGNVIQ